MQLIRAISGIDSGIIVLKLHQETVKAVRPWTR